VALMLMTPAQSVLPLHAVTIDAPRIMVTNPLTEADATDSCAPPRRRSSQAQAGRTRAERRNIVDILYRSARRLAGDTREDPTGKRTPGTSVSKSTFWAGQRACPGISPEHARGVGLEGDPNEAMGATDAT
jgi:hypothetical protein